MNPKTIIFVTALLSSAGLGPRTAHADVFDGIGPWRGTGTLHGPDGRELSSFKVELTRTALDAQTVETRGTVTLAGGERVTFEESITRAKSGFTIRSQRGQGTGNCFGADLCSTHEDAGNGHTSDTTIVVDGPDRVRVLMTDYEDGEVVQVLRETLIRTK